MGSSKLATDGKGRWYRRWMDGNKEHRSRVAPKEEAELESEYGEAVKGRDTNVEINKLPEQVIDGEVRDSLRRIITDDTIQKQKDEISLDMQKRGGGVITLNKPSNRSEDRGERQKVISDLYKKSKRGDEDAKQKLDGLWKLTIPHLRELERSGSLVVVGCPKCNTGIDPDISECPVCGWSKYDSGYSKSFDEIIRGGKDR